MYQKETEQLPVVKRPPEFQRADDSRRTTALSLHKTLLGLVLIGFDNQGLSCLIPLPPSLFERAAPLDDSRGEIVPAYTGDGTSYGQIAPIGLAPLLPRHLRDDHLLERVITPNSHPLLRSVLGVLEGNGRPDEIPLSLRGSSFQLQVWGELSRIPLGQTISYGELARRIGHPQSARAVAQACGSNPVAVIVPCHRVVAANGALGGYRWGLSLKRTLLDREGAL